MEGLMFAIPSQYREQNVNSVYVKFRASDK